MAFLPFSQQAKKWEPIAIALRRLAGVSDGELLDPCDLASKVGLRLVDANFALEDFSAEGKHYLLIAARDHWSGGVLPQKLPDGSCVCILNPDHPRRRNRITLMEGSYTCTAVMYQLGSLRVYRDFECAAMIAPKKPKHMG